ncbi:hypothetical protein OPV22_029306 [Ensete ventricosum]|uniref:Uncharacterized protein n=1 Tax=Ensete ventricosum TaxID=4639 RepID=A0AAV8Q5G6_ENSVE|nr:hypothetical protein OPV22_029306 [Ensete ventricosum]
MEPSLLRTLGADKGRVKLELRSCYYYASSHIILLVLMDSETNGGSPHDEVQPIKCVRQATSLGSGLAPSVGQSRSQSTSSTRARIAQ